MLRICEERDDNLVDEVIEDLIWMIGRAQYDDVNSEQ
jgi:hypothetical protein